MKRLAVLLLAGLTLTGCISPKTYVDPNFGKSSYSDVQSVTEKYDAKIIIEFQRNGDLYSAANSEVRGHVERTLRATGIITPVAENSKISIKVTVNNVADMGSAAAKGFGTGLTFGAVGTTVTDYYEVSIIYTDESGITTTKDYKHALHTTIGNEKAPMEGVTPTTAADGFGTVVEQVLLNFVTDMQKNGELTIITSKLVEFS